MTLILWLNIDLQISITTVISHVCFLKIGQFQNNYISGKWIWTRLIQGRHVMVEYLLGYHGNIDMEQSDKRLP